MYHAELKKFEDINFGSGDEISLIVDEVSTTNDKTSEPASLDPSVRLLGYL